MRVEPEIVQQLKKDEEGGLLYTKKQSKKDDIYFNSYENKCKLNLNQHHAILDKINQGILVIQDKKIKYCNSKIKEILGYSAEEIASIQFTEIIHPDDKERIKDYFLKRYDENGSSELHRYRLIDNLGKIKWTEINKEIIQWEGNPAILYFITDISDRIKIEIKKEGSKQRLIDILNSSIDWLWEVDKNGKYVFASEKVEKILGYRPEELYNRTPFEFMPRDESIKVKKIFKKISSKKKPIKDLENWNITKDGKKICLLTNGVPILGKNGELMGYRGVDKDITESKKAHQAIIENEKFLNNVLNSINDGISVLDKKLTVVRTNYWMEKMYKGNIPLTGKKCYKIYQNRDSICPFCPSIKAMELKSTQETIVPYPSEKNPQGWMSLSAFPLISTNGEVSGVIEYVKDITNQKKIELSLKESEERYRNLFESSPEAILCVNNKGFVTSVNPAFEKIHGYDKEDIIGRHFTKLKLLSIKDIPKYVNIFKKLIKGQIVNPIFVRTKNLKTEQYHDLEVSFTQLCENDKVTGIQSISRDITEKKEKEKLLLESEERYQSLFNRSLDLVYIYDFKGNFIDANDACFDLLGHTKEDIKNLNFSTFLDKGQILKAFKVIREVKKNGFQKEPAFFRLKTKNGKFIWVETSSSLIYHNGKPHAMQGIARDVTQRMNDEEDLKKAHKKLRELNKNLEKKVEERTEKINQLLKQKDEFINQLGHDLKNPLNPLVNLLPIIEKDESDPKRKEMLEVINRNVGYMKNLVIKTIELARLNSSKMKFIFEEINLLNQINSVITSNKILFDEKKIQIINNINNNIWVKADKLRFEELFNNLLNNALKYSKKNGLITFDAQVNKDFVTVVIKDNGIGMTKEQLHHIFDEFYKADESRHSFDSSGLGMTICKRIVEKHKGQIWANSGGPGKGSAFYFTLPLTKNVEMIKLKET